MEYLKFLIISVLNLIISGGLAFGLFKYLTHDIGNSTGDMGMGIFSVLFSVVVFVLLLLLIGFILFTTIL